MLNTCYFLIVYIVWNLIFVLILYMWALFYRPNFKAGVRKMYTSKQILPHLCFCYLVSLRQGPPTKRLANNPTSCWSLVSSVTNSTVIHWNVIFFILSQWCRKKKIKSSWYRNVIFFHKKCSVLFLCMEQNCIVLYRSADHSGCFAMCHIIVSPVSTDLVFWNPQYQKKRNKKINIWYLYIEKI